MRKISVMGQCFPKCCEIILNVVQKITYVSRKSELQQEKNELPCLREKWTISCESQDAPPGRAISLSKLYIFINTYSWRIVHCLPNEGNCLLLGSSKGLCAS